MMAPLIDAAMSRSRTVMTILIMLLIAGFYAYRTIPKESNPDIDIPLLYVSMALEGISPDDSERLLLRPMEQELSAIEGVKEMRSTGYFGGGFVLMEFQAGFDKDKALDDVQKAVDQAKINLPDSMDHDPEVTEVNFSLFPVLVVTLSGDVPERTLVRLARYLQDKMEALPTVLQATISGDREELVEILVDPVQLESYGLDGAQILQFFQRSNRLIAAGELDTGTGRFAIKVPGLFEKADDVLDLPLKTEGDSVIRVRDIAQIRRTFKDPQNFARINGERAVALNIVKRTGENIIETIEAVQSVVDQEKAAWPDDIKVVYTLDQSDDIRTMLADLENNMISSILLVMIIIVASLGLRASTLVGVSVPGSFLAGILIIYMMGLTVNVVVLFSLILSVGMLVDAAIVVVEYADRKMVEGHPKKQAYTEAAKRMAWPITTSTATILASFFPLLFWPGIVGEFMKYMPITLIAVLGSSLVMALVFIPVLGGIFGKPSVKDEKALKALAASEEGDLRELHGWTGLYVRFLDKALNRPGLVLLASLGFLVGAQLLYGVVGKGVEFFPNIEPKAASILVHARGNLSIYQQDTLVRAVEDRILDVQGIKVFYTEAGRPGQQGNENMAADVIGKITLEFTEWDTRKKADEILQEIRERTQDIAGIHVEAQKQEEGPGSGKAVQIEISSHAPEILPEAVKMVRAALDEAGGFIDIEDSLPLPGVEWKLAVDRAQASKYGVDLSLIGDYVRMVTNGFKIAEYRPNDSDDEIDIVIRHQDEDRTLTQLDKIRVKSENGMVPIANFMNREPQAAVGTINRVDQRRVMTVKADVTAGINVNAKVEELKTWMQDNRSQIDPRLEIKFKGEDEDQRESQAFLGKAFIVALFLMAIIMVTQFNSFYSTFLILYAVVMSTVGVFIGLMLTGQPFGIVMSGIGVIALAGIVVNNNIVLIDTFDHIMRTGRFTLREAVLRTGAQRLRPVFLTSITTVLGLIPMVFQTNIDFIARNITVGAPSTQWWVQLSTAVAFGVTFATILTLIITPCALMMRDCAQRFKIQLKGMVNRKKNDEFV